MCRRSARASTTRPALGDMLENVYFVQNAWCCGLVGRHGIERCDSVAGCKE